jgi:hypothetical protein
LDKLDISTIQRIKIVNRYLLNKDLFSVYISHINYNEIANKTIRYPKGNIIMKINNKEFNNYKEFTKIIKNPIINFTTIENNEYFL